MKLLITTAVRITGLVIAFTVLSAALSVIVGTPAAVSLEREYIGGDTLTVFGREIDTAAVMGFVSWMEGVIDKTTALLPAELEESAAEALDAIGRKTESAVQYFTGRRP